jgi:hypothetical protein
MNGSLAHHLVAGIFVDQGGYERGVAWVEVLPSSKAPFEVEVVLERLAPR